MWCIQVSCGRAQSSSDSWAPELELKEDENRWTYMKEIERTRESSGQGGSVLELFPTTTSWCPQHQRPGARMARSQLWTVTSCIFLLLPDFSRIFLLKAHGERHPQHKESANSTVFLLLSCLSCDLNLLNRSLLAWCFTSMLARFFHRWPSSIVDVCLLVIPWGERSCTSFLGFIFLKRFERICGFIGPQWIVTLLQKAALVMWLQWHDVPSAFHSAFHTRWAFSGVMWVKLTPCTRALCLANFNKIQQTFQAA